MVVNGSAERLNYAVWMPTLRVRWLSSRRSIKEDSVVRVAGVHPFRLWLLANGKTQDAAARELGISAIYLSLILGGRRTPSRELLRDIVAYTKRGVKMAELVTFKEPSEFPRRKQPKRPSATKELR